MPRSKLPTWRNDIDALAFQPDHHGGICVVHRRALPRQCVDFYLTHRGAFQAAARAKVLRASVAESENFHLTSRDVARELKNSVAPAIQVG